MSRWKLPCLDLFSPRSVVIAAALAVLAPALALAQAPRPRLANLQLPLAFEANRGQTDSRAQFLARTAGGVVFLTHQGAVVKTPSHALELRFAGSAAAPQARGLRPLSGGVHYFIGSARARSTAAYAQVRYSQIYPGVDVLYYGSRGSLEYDLELSPRAAASRIQLAVQGGQPSLAADGSLQLAPGVRLRAPSAYQTINGRRQPVGVRYALLGAGSQPRVGFALAPYDHSRALTIDPVLAFASLLGGSGFNTATAVAVDAAGSGYIVGATMSADFPTLSAFQAALAPGTLGPANDAFVTKFSIDGKALVYSTFLGGNGDDSATGVAVDSTGAAYVTWSTSSTNFPTASPLQASLKGANNAFVAKLDPTGATLVYSTYLGGSSSDAAAGIALDGNNDAYITGTTNSSDFPTTLG
ncbi:MAG: SBBP repeat-containing protein, partial [Terriglobales bacterium]